MSALIHRIKQYVTATGVVVANPAVAISFDAGAPLNDVPSITGTFVYVAADGTKTNLVAPAEIAVEVSDDDGTTWVEPPNLRFAILNDSSDAIKIGDSGSVSGVGMAWQLCKARVFETPGEPLDTDHRRTFSTVTPGGLMSKFITEAQARGVLSWMDISTFSSVTDSNGTAWPLSMGEVAYETGTDLLQILTNLAGSGLIDWHMVGRSLRIYAADTYLANDKIASVYLREGTHFTEGGVSRKADELASYILIKGDSETAIIDNTSTAYEPWGTWESVVASSGSGDAATMQLLADLASITSSQVRVQKTLQIAPTADPTGVQSFTDYAVGDTIRTRCLDTDEDLRIYQLTLTYGSDSGTRVAIVVGDRILEAETRLTRRLAGITGGIIGEVGNGTIPTPELDPSIPATPVFGTAFTNVYQSLVHNRETRAQIQLTWTQPLNQDGSSITDGLKYEIRYRPNVTVSYAATWDEVSAYHWDNVYTWDQPLIPPIDETEWHYIEVPWDVLTTMIQELTPRVVYEFQIRAYDQANQASPWSASDAVTAAKDNIPPSQPAAPAVAGNMLSVQIVHTLAVEGGAPYSLEPDAAFLKVFVIGEPSYVPTDADLVGIIPGIGECLASQVPAVASFHLPDIGAWCVKVSAVDVAGNESVASLSNAATAILIDDAHISDLSVSKITAGSISVDWILAASLKTAVDGQRLELGSTGLQAYDSDGLLTINLSNDPDITGQFISFRSAGETLASIDDEGKGSFQEVYAPVLYVAGQDIMLDVIDRRPRGIVAWGQSSDDVAGAAPAVDRGYLELAFTAESGRAYNINFFGEVESTSATAGERYIFTIRDGYAEEPSTSSPDIGGSAFAATLSAGRNDTGYFIIAVRCPEDMTAGLHRLLWCFQATVGTATMRGTDGPAYFFVEDIGPSDLLDNTAILNDGNIGAGGGGSTSTPPPVKKTYTKRYYATWSGTYDGVKDRITYYGSEMVQGNRPFTNNGNCAGMVGFSSQIKADLAGSTVKSVKFTAYANHWYYNSGGTAVLGWHNYTSRPSSWSSGCVTEDSTRSSSWPKPGQRTVTLSTATFGAALKSGSARGIMIGRGASDSVLYYGRFNGNGMSKEPYLDIVYTK
jgi:hypothetical protein